MWLRAWGLTASAGLSWDVCRCSLGRELASLPCVQPVRGLFLGELAASYRQARGALGPLSSSRLYLLASQGGSIPKGERRLQLLEAKVKPRHFCGCLLVQTLPRSPRFGRNGETLCGHI